MFITKKYISRRTVLRGAGVALALPFLDSMVPAQTPLARTAAAGKQRFTGLFVPHGMAPGYWVPEGPALDPAKLPPILEPLKGVIDQSVVLSGMWSKSAEPPEGVTGADHWVAAAFMAGQKPKKATGADIYNGITIDQIIAQKIGQESLLPSLQQAIEDPGANSSNCGEGYSCAYTNSISWASHSTPLPMELNPQVVFERLFGDVQAKTAEQRAQRRAQDRSILDSITQSLASFKADLGPATSSASRSTPIACAKSSVVSKSQASRRARSIRKVSSCRPACRIRSTNTSSCSSTCRLLPTRPTSRAFRPCSMLAT